MVIKDQNGTRLVSLDNASHLLMNRRDSRYVSDVIGAWSDRYLSGSKGRKNTIPYGQI